MRGHLWQGHSNLELINHESALVNQGILFSGGTYQVEVRDPKTKKSFWPFIQLSNEGTVLDQFCSCSEAEKKKTCLHLVKALEQIFNHHTEPLHVRFQSSLWNALCRMACHTAGYKVSCLEKTKNSFKAFSPTKKQLVSLEPQNASGDKTLNKILFERTVETEETSLKFSNLSPEELSLWRQGKPSMDLSYELSFWSDIAKWLMSLQENKKKYTITFKTKQNQLPHEISLVFSDIVCTFYIPHVQLPWIIPTLATVKSPLAVHLFSKKQIKTITYLPEERAFAVEHALKTPHIEQEKLHGIPCADWVFIENIGFFPSNTDPLFEKEKIHDVGLMLHKHLHILRRYLVGTHLNPPGTPTRYHLFFDAELQLHIQCYLFDIEDFKKPEAAMFGSYAYLPNHGFYPLENLLFEGPEKIIPQNKIGAFVNQYRHWLHTHEGFQVHMSSIDTRCTYSVSDKGALRFDVRIENISESIDCGEWVYIPGKGFYPKLSLKEKNLIKPGLEIPNKHVAAFIQKHQEELEPITHFFSSSCPIEKSGVHVGIEPDGCIYIRPEYVFLPSYKNKHVKLFSGEVSFVEQEGFYILPQYARVPSVYAEPRKISKEEETSFVFYDLPELRPLLLSVDPCLQTPQDLSLSLKRLKKDPKTRRAEWIVELVYKTEIGETEIFPIWEALCARKRYLFTNSGLLFLHSPHFSWLKGITKKRWIKKGKQLRLTTLEWLRLITSENISEPIGTSVTEKQTREILEEFLSFRPTQSLDLSGLKSSLRPYQEAGVLWLWFLYTYGLSGLLCDEMGLGKTHQAMGLLVAASNTQKHKQRHLVICPTSVLCHWEDLLKRFLPHIQVSLFHGTGRSIEEGSSIILTSYGMLRSSKEIFKKLQFDIAIFDEIQSAKNIRSQTHKALCSLNAKMRVGLTGTPIENHLGELKALFDLVLPGYLPKESVFRDLFTNPIEKFQDATQKNLLSRLIRPFLMRRKKTDVLLELPEKIEEISYCYLSEEQKALYKQVFLEHKEGIMQALSSPENTVPYPHIFSLLSKLKQICNHPCLFLKKEKDYSEHTSGKWDLFIELLQEAKESGLKVVVFSQYLGMLDIFIDHLKHSHIGYASIRGSTTLRKEQLEKFRDDPACLVFVASLQAAGVGIDLVAASVVIHFDRWWNPAKENQATARVYRMGQKNRNIQVFKIVTRDTIEEHIHNIIEKKNTLLEGVIGFDEQDEIKTLNRQELIDLLTSIDKDITIF